MLPSTVFKVVSFEDERQWQYSLSDFSETCHLSHEKKGRDDKRVETRHCTLFRHFITQTVLSLGLFRQMKLCSCWYSLNKKDIKILLNEVLQCFSRIDVFYLRITHLYVLKPWTMIMSLKDLCKIGFDSNEMKMNPSITSGYKLWLHFIKIFLWICIL